MANLNQVTILGNLTRDVELRHTRNDTPVTTLGVAVNDRRKNDLGQWVEDTTFVDATAWGRVAEFVAERGRKGDSVLIVGRLRQETWQTADGANRSRLVVVAEPRWK